MNTYSAEREAKILAYQQSFRNGCPRSVAIAMTRTEEERLQDQKKHERAAKRIFDDIMVDGGWSV